MTLDDARSQLAARYNCTPDQLLEENTLLWEIVIDMLREINEAGRVECPELYGFGVNKLQVLKSYLSLRGRHQQ